MISRIRNFIRNFADGCSSFLRADGWFFFLLIILNTPVFFQWLVYLNAVELRYILTVGFVSFYSGAAIILVFCAAIHFLLAKFPRAKFFLQMLIIICAAAFFVINAFLLYKFNFPLQKHMIQIVIGTNPATVKEFFQTYVLEPKVILGAAAIIFLTAAAVKNFRALFQNSSEQNLRRISCHMLIIFTPAVLFSVGDISGSIKNSFNNTLLGRNFNNIRAAIDAVGDESEILAAMDAQDEKVISNGAEIPCVVFVLGEAVSRNHMQLYGYALENNPLLTARYENGELFRFSDIIACANNTAPAMEMIFTFSEKTDPEENWYRKPNIFDILRRAGYHTVWISNQSPISFWGNTDKIYSERCDEKFFPESAKGGITKDFDGILLPAIDEFLASAHDKNFYFVHLYGAHQAYSLRYPKDFEKFTAADEDKPTAEGRKVAAEYDNAIFYGDYVLDEIFKRFEDKTALVIYISDHGQEVFEGGRDFAGHASEETGSRSMIEIPMLVWTSEKFRELYPEKISAVAAAVDRPYRTDFIIHAILDLLDIRTQSFEPEKSIVNEKFSPAARIYNGKPYVPEGGLHE